MSNWWANKLGTQPSAPTSPQTYLPATQANAPVQYQQTPPQPVGNPQELTEGGWTEALQKGYNPGLAAKAGHTANCPSCGSANYFATLGNSVMTANGPVHPAGHCYECGYPNTQGPNG